MPTKYKANTRVGVDGEQDGKPVTYWFEYGEDITVVPPEAELAQLLANGSVIPVEYEVVAQAPEVKKTPEE